jgi:hypothetical protein
LIAIGLVLQFADLWGFAHRFIEVTPRAEETHEFQTILDRTLDNGRVAREWNDLLLTSEDRYDDAGGFDSLFLARSNRALLALASAPPDTNRELIDASELPVKALGATGVHFVITTKNRKDLDLVGSTDDARLYRVPNPAPRVAFFTQAQTESVAEEQLPELFVAQPRDRLLLPVHGKKYAWPEEHRVAGESTIRQHTIDFSRPSSDEFVFQIANDRPGFVYLLEAYDPGWAASVDGAAAPLLAANGFALAVPVAAGPHTIRLQYQTPGRTLGEGLSPLSFCLLIVLLVSVPGAIPPGTISHRLRQGPSQSLAAMPASGNLI